MPEYVSGYELLQLNASSRGSTETVRFAEKRYQFSSGFRSQVLYGNRLGLRKWSITYDPLPGDDHDATIVMDGVAMTPAKYLRDLFRRHKRSGRPFAVLSTETGNYYLARFDETAQSLQKKLGALYTTQINLIQQRIPGSTIFED